MNPEPDARAHLEDAGATTKVRSRETLSCGSRAVPEVPDDPAWPRQLVAEFELPPTPISALRREPQPVTAEAIPALEELLKRLHA
jgi:hypothetical protein